MSDPLSAAGTPSPSVGRVLRLGWSEALSHVPTAALLWLTHFAQAVIQLAVFGLLMGGLGSIPTKALGVGGVILAVAWLLASMGRLLTLAGALRRSAARLQGEAPGPWGSSVLQASGTALSFLWVELLLSVTVLAWQLAAVFASGGAFLKSVAVHTHGIPTSAALGLALGLSLLLGGASTVVLQMALVRAVVRAEGVLCALWESCATLGRRPWGPVLVVLATSAAGGFLRLSFAVGAGAPREQFAHHVIELLVLGSVLTAAAVSSLQALLDLTRFHALTALELATMGRLPPPANPVRAAPVPVAEWVVDALPVGPPGVPQA